MVHLHVIGPNLHDTDASYPYFKDFASSIKSDDEPLSGQNGKIING
jgi:hypothetical protein